MHHHGQMGWPGFTPAQLLARQQGRLRFATGGQVVWLPPVAMASPGFQKHWCVRIPVALQGAPLAGMPQPAPVPPCRGLDEVPPLLQRQGPHCRDAPARRPPAPVSPAQQNLVVPAITGRGQGHPIHQSILSAALQLRHDPGIGLPPQALQGCSADLTTLHQQQRPALKPPDQPVLEQRKKWGHIAALRQWNGGHQRQAVPLLHQLHRLLLDRHHPGGNPQEAGLFRPGWSAGEVVRLKTAKPARHNTVSRTS